MTQTLFLSGSRVIAGAGKLDTDKRYLFKLEDQNQFYLPIGQSIGINEYGLFRYSVGNVIWQTSNASAPVSFDATYEAWGIGGISGTPAVQSPPVTSDISETVTTGTSGIIDLKNYVTGSYFSLGIVAPPVNGTIIWVDSSQTVIQYDTSAAGGTTDSFTFQAYGPGGPSNISTVSIAIQAAPIVAPTCSDATVFAPVGSTVYQFDISVNVQGTWDSIVVVTAPQSGTATISGATATYTANAPISHPFNDSFTFQAFNQGQASNVATLYVVDDTAPPPPG